MKFTIDMELNLGALGTKNAKVSGVFRRDLLGGYAVEIERVSVAFENAFRFMPASVIDIFPEIPEDNLTILTNRAREMLADLDWAKPMRQHHDV